MSNEYLWGKTGEPDADLPRLERELGALGFRYDPAAAERLADAFAFAFSAQSALALSAPTFSLLESKSVFARLRDAARDTCDVFLADPARFLANLFAATPFERRRNMMLARCLTVTIFFHMFAYAVVSLIPSKPATKPEREYMDAVYVHPEPLVTPPTPAAGTGFGRNGSSGSAPGRPNAAAALGHPRPKHADSSAPGARPTNDLQTATAQRNPADTPVTAPGFTPGSTPVPRGENGNGGSGGDTGSGTGNGTQPGTGSETTAAPQIPTGETRLKAEILSQEKPRYTEAARRLGIQGEVLLDVEFLPDGTIGRVVVLRGLGHGLDENAVDAARHIRFRPALRNGVPFATRAVCAFTFKVI